MTSRLETSDIRCCRPDEPIMHRVAPARVCGSSMADIRDLRECGRPHFLSSGCAVGDCIVAVQYS